MHILKPPGQHREQAVQSDVDLHSMLSWDGVSETSTDINDVDWDDLLQCFNVEVDTEVCNVCNQEFLAQPGYSSLFIDKENNIVHVMSPLSACINAYITCLKTLLSG